MNGYDSLPDAVTEVFGEEATAERAYDLLTVDVPPSAWLTALETARDTLGCTYFDWLSAVDEPGTGFRVCAHVVALGEGAPKRLLLRTTVPHEAPALPTAIGVYAGAGWHERETHEMFGVTFEGHPHLVPLLLPENFEGHPLRKDFVLAARVAKAWPGAKEPGESHDGGGPKRRQMLPPGVPDPNEWGPLKGQLPPAPARPARAAAGDRPVRRTRTATEGSASQAEPAAPVRRSRSASEGSASQAAAEPGAPVRRSRSAAEGSASQAAAAAAEPDAAPDAPAARPPRRSRSAADGSASQTAPETGGRTAPDTTGPAPSAAAAAPRTRSSDAPWHHARPAFDDETQPPAPKEPTAATPAPTAATPATETPSATPATETPSAAPATETPTPEPEAPAAPVAPPPGPEAPAPAAAPAPGPEAPAAEGAPAPEPEAPAPEPEAPAAPSTPASEPEGQAPAATPAPGPEGARAAGADEDRTHEPPAGRDRGTDTPNDPAGGDPA
ncbi:NADH-quinone oxidoreductase subunit C [Streptomyces sp. NK15101]|uniref:NADH-quinone oxidoreductase subunit C n=1 Tax=Streptomyces sp. NK15101 TaxID=2873261 RepID=UPI001CEC3F2E|nr:NADH-quinone oxidoreductase subunit C [Streptomyces sp. NK15101]